MSRKNDPLRYLARLAVVVALCGCGASEDGLGTSRQELVGANSLYWPTSPMWDPYPTLGSRPPLIPVCFEATAQSTPAIRAQIKDIVERRWQRYGRINFTEWSDCTPGAPGIHVEVHAGGGSSSGTGTQLNGATNGIRLDVNDNSPDGRRFVYVVAHEFGHAVGMFDEEARADYSPAGDRNGSGVPDDSLPQWWGAAAENVAGRCAKQPSPTNVRYYGSYDVTSVMSFCGNYCRDSNCSNVHPELSPNDVASLQTAYGRRIPGQLVTPNGDCAAAQANHSDNRTFIWDCDEYENDQEFVYLAAMQRFHIPAYNPSLNFCLESSIYDPVASAFTSSACTDYISQKWRFDLVYLRGWGGLCLDLQGGNTNNGRVQLWECGALGGANQKWTLMETGEVKYGASTSTRCLGSDASGAMVVTTCNGGADQQFDILSGGMFRRRSSQKCLDAQGPSAWAYSPTDGSAGSGLPANGTSVQEYTCLSEQLNQRFNTSGRILHVATNTCLERIGGSNANGTGLRRIACNGSDAQTWDYYFK